ncbi:hypothetical protein [Anaerocolumna cellulosilytica]|nr:hypothetical protein [Anaerocolumna cellulosilytica]MBB5198091.1 hypothetical protein [Anaerocolumna cellulosilytica]
MRDLIFYITIVLLFSVTIVLVLQLLSVALKNKRIFSYRSNKILKGKERLLPALLFLAALLWALLYLIIT